MNIIELIEILKKRFDLVLSSSNFPNQKITALAYDTRQLPYGVPVELFDLNSAAHSNVVLILSGHQTYPSLVEHIKRFPPALIISHPEMIEYLNNKIPKQILLAKIDNIKPVSAFIATQFFPHAPQHIIAVTGTNGKSSTVSFMRQLWSKLGYAAASIGTLGVERSDSGSFFEASLSPSLAPSLDLPAALSALTTPNAIDLHYYLQRLCNERVSHVAIEASSHGLEQGRLSEINLSAAVFTNLTHDHLDYHKNIETYFAAKQILFKDLLPIGGFAILNLMQPEIFNVLREICLARQQKIFTYGLNAGDVCLHKYKWNNAGYDLELKINGHIYSSSTSLVGEIQLQNLLGAIATLISLGAPPAAIARDLPHLTSVRGRLQLVAAPAAHGAVYVDYAHTPDGLRTVLANLAALQQRRGSIHLVFGCGGNRDTAKREIMGRIAAELADQVYITDDNPRYEDPAAIRAMIIAGCNRGQARNKVIEVPDRKSAIHQAIRASKPEDIVLIAGKGHEAYQQIKGVSYDFDDAGVALAFINNVGAAIQKK